MLSALLDKLSLVLSTHAGQLLIITPVLGDPMPSLVLVCAYAHVCISVCKQ